VSRPHPDGYTIRTDGVPAQRVHHWLSTDAYWAAGRDLDTVTRALAASLVYGLFDATGDLVGVARAVTDGATFAWIADVYVDRAHRGRGLGTWLVEELTAALRAAGVRRLVLATRDAHEVYARVAYAPLRWPERWMEIDLR